MPLAVDLAKVKPGTWAEYSMNIGGLPPMTTRLALVSKSGDTHTLEMSMEGGITAMTGGKMVVDTVMQTEKKTGAPKVQKIVMQLGAHDPMEMPDNPALKGQFAKPDPKALVGEETIKVAAGSFKTKHYRDKSPSGDTVDFWISESAPPIGLVKMTGEQKAGPPGVAGPVKLELTATGKDAKPLITKPPKPYSESELRQQVMSGAGAGGPGAAPPPAQPPAAPAKK
jgi:hypothetical protein